MANDGFIYRVYFCMLIWIGAISAILIGILGLGWYYSQQNYRGTPTDHFDGKRFHNPDGKNPRSVWAGLRWRLVRKREKWRDNYETYVGEPPVRSSENLILTFVNHSTFLIQWNDLNVLTDPIWSERCGPPLIAPKRKRPPGLNFDTLPEIHLVLISHNHFDHLDMETVQRVEDKFHPLFIIPLGIGELLSRHGINRYKELDWWESTDSGLTVTGLPAQHFSGRGMFDRCNTLWCGYLLEHKGRKLYVCGDTSFGTFFSEIRERTGAPDVSLIPIGAYKPRWFNGPVHVCPSEAVEIHKIMGSDLSIAKHFGTFQLADDGEGTAESDLLTALKEENIDPDKFVIPEEGVPIRLDF